MTKTTAPYGKWKSPISVSLLTGSSITIPEFLPHGKNDLYFIESRPFEGGRSVVVKMDHEGKTMDMVGPKVNVRSRVHEYGGAGFVVGDKGLIYSNFSDNRLFHVPSLDKPEKVDALTPEGTPLRYARFMVHPSKDLLVAVCEDHTKAVPADVQTYLVTIDLESKKQKTIVSGNDFYSDPIFSPSGDALAWREWSHPEMPWTCSSLYVGKFDGEVSDTKRIAGGTPSSRSSVTQPRFMPDGILLFCSDETGYQQIYKSAPPYDKYSLVTKPIKGDFASPDWTFGNSNYTIVQDSTNEDSQNNIIATHGSEEAKLQISRINVNTGTLEKIDHPFLTVDGIEANPAFPELVYVTGSTKEEKGLFSFYCKNGDIKVLKALLPKESKVDSAYMSLAQPFECESANGRKTFGWYYPPTSPDHQAPEGTFPPLLMRIHGGPTSASPPVTSLQISYWTSRGYAFFSSNYGGSTGYGRKYMESLDSNWGVVDSEDAVAAAEHLASSGLCDKDKMAIDGGSAGGYTVLNILCHSTVFAAGCSLYGVSELKALAEDTHKFESQYLFNLVGGTPAEIPEVYKKRSPLYHAGKIKNPIMVQQGTEDMVVPINQAKDMVDAINANGAICEFLEFKGEGHGFRGREAQQASLEGETKFFEKYLKL